MNGVLFRRQIVVSALVEQDRRFIVSEPTVAEATARVYQSLEADNADIDPHIAALRAALTRECLNEALFDPGQAPARQSF